MICGDGFKIRSTDDTSQQLSAENTNSNVTGDTHPDAECPSKCPSDGGSSADDNGAQWVDINLLSPELRALVLRELKENK